MPRQREILLDAWREACQHIEIQLSAAGILQLAAEHVPLRDFRVLRLDLATNHLAIVAAGGAAVRPAEQFHELPPRSAKRLASWIRAADWATVPDSGETPVERRWMGLARLTEPMRIGPLAQGDDLGILAISIDPSSRWSERHAALLDAMLEPLSVALGNDRRMHELAALREAAEADRRSLLTRLGRTDITDQVVGADAGLAPVMHRAGLVSSSDAPVLLLGETGTGKEVIARHIHNHSPRHAGPFIRVNCGAIPHDLIDSQLFGHEKGAFTGAGETRAGWFERADGGTLFLDEIGELPTDAQVRFLRVLQDSFIERVGGREPIRVEVRVIAATHRDLAAMVQSGQFREDLWYRIAVFPILLPPLRDRLGDVPELARHFARRAAHRFGLSPVIPSPSDLELLRGYHWPGNIRELGAVIDRAAILGEGHSLEIAAALGFAGPVRAATPMATPTPGSAPPLATLDLATKQHIERALTATGGKIEGPGGAAEVLAINPHTLRARMRKLGIDWSRFRRG